MLSKRWPKPESAAFVWCQGGGGGGGFSDMLMGAANAYFTAEGVEEMVDLMDEAGQGLRSASNCDMQRNLI